MANRFPLVVDSSNLNIKELPSGDNLDLTGSAVVNGAWQGTSISTTYTDAKIASVSNTAPITATTSGNAVTIGMLTSGIAAGTYGNATTVPAITVDAYGRVTAVTNSTITGGVTTGKSIAMAIVFGG